MATKSYGRRACTEMPDNGQAFDLDNLPDEEIPAAAEDLDDIDF